MKTLIIYNDIESIRYTIVEGDHSRFNGVCVNSTKTTGFEEEFCNWFFNEDGYCKFVLSNDKKLIEDKEWDKVVIATWLP